MAPRVTRGAAAREAAKVSAAAKVVPEKDIKQPQTIAPETKEPEVKKIAPKKKRSVKAPPAENSTAQKAKSETQGEANAAPVNNANTSKKRKRAPAPKPKPEVDPEELPHGMGKLWKPSTKENNVEAAPESEAPAAIKESKDVAMNEENQNDTDKPLSSPAATTQTDVKKASQQKKARTKKGNTKKAA
ncbi:MAG: hypothetical protein Q9183_006355, partial [Haloplaca sp. 2 TL-2023]